MITLEKIPLWKDVDSSIAVTRYVRGGEDVVRPAMLVVPGGGYGCVCTDTEGTPIAERFLSLGFQVFLLNYRVKPARYPEPQQDIIRAVKLIRAHASEWHVKKDNIAGVGFSAGGHLVACAGTIVDDIDASAGDEADAESGRLNAMLLAYAVITFVGKHHQGSLNNLVGEENFDAWKQRLSLESRVTEQTPPAFLWHTLEDQLVPFENSILLAQALAEKKIPAELHLYPHGCHGKQLGYGMTELEIWPEQAKTFLENSCGFQFPKHIPARTIVLTFDDACRSHLDIVAPILRKYGFGATFFVTRFTDEWRAKHASEQLNAAGVKALYDLGFEIGNHTWSHPDTRKMTPKEVDQELESLNCFLVEAGVPLPRSFAYPGGPYSEAAENSVYRHAYQTARTTEKRAWDIYKDSRFQVPAIPIQGDDPQAFLDAIALAEEDHPVVLVFHGVPDTVHPWVNTPVERFEQYMEYLAENNYRVIAMKDAWEMK